MLVYLKEPMAYTTLGGFRIYGRQYCKGKFGPVDLPLRVYEEHKEILEDAYYTQKWLASKFGEPFVHNKFRIVDLRHLEFKHLVEIAIYVGVRYSRDNRLEPSIKERNAIIKSIIMNLNS